MATYQHRKIEKKWQEEWKKRGLYKTEDKVKGKKNFYALVEFLYPSGDVHIGHWYAFCVPDIFVRMKRMLGFNVLYPMGFDAFGLPAENAAIKNKVNPSKWTWGNIERARSQIQSMGAAFDWSREVVTCDPRYYKWTQWLFLKLFEKDLAFQKKAFVNWCPQDKTVLANEQVIQGHCERCDSVVEQKELEQWFLKITNYAEELLSGLDGLNWPEEIKESQRNWIGRSEGAILTFKIKDHKQGIKVFTTRPDTLYGATYVVLAPEHELILQLKDYIENLDELFEYAEISRKKSELERTAEGKEKTGIALKGVKAINPANNEEIPIFIADYVLAGYGTGAIMAVPAHDERDFAFAEKYDLPAREVITGGKTKENAYIGSGLLINSGKFNDLNNEEAGPKITKYIGGKTTATYRLKDWLVSRQRYWGCPIPIVYDPNGNPHPIPDEHLPWLLPADVDFTPTGESPLARSKELKERTEKIFGKGWRPEHDTMDTFVDSSWYFLRYTEPKNDTKFASQKALKTWMPVNRYSGGAEHTTMHLLYSRFFHRALYALGLVAETEPYQERFNRGIILGPDGRKMSKRWGNVVNPDEYVQQVGADTVRVYLGFIGPYNIVGHYPWDLGGIVGTRRFLERVWTLQTKTLDTEQHAAESKIECLMHQTIKKVGEDIEKFKFNTAISQLMILLNEMEKQKTISNISYKIFLQLLAPFAPHITEELWERLGEKESIHKSAWPVYDPKKIVTDTATIVVQINGKIRDSFEEQRTTKEDVVTKKALALPRIQKVLLGKEPRRIIYVPQKLVNFVT